MEKFLSIDMKNVSLLFIVLMISVASLAQKKMQLIESKEKKRIDVLWNGKLLTSYRWDDSVAKPFLFPVNTPNGITVTRGWPLEPRAGERTDHPHHTGVWMNYESVNGLDFWNNSTAIPADKRNLYGSIRHDAIVKKLESNNSATLQVKASWLHPDGHVLLKEETSFHFKVSNNQFIIERKTVLTSLNEPVVFKDAKDGFYAIRVARELELPSTEAGNFTDAHGNVTNVPKMVSNEGVTGNYISSARRTGDSVWGTKGTWVMLQGKKDAKDITIAIIDHPKNIGYPSYWHARAYGLFAVNPLGRKIFSNGKEELNFTLKPNTSVTFTYSLIIAERKFSEKEMNKMADEFGKKRE
jgi:hypothetical protein